MAVSKDDTVLCHAAFCDPRVWDGFRHTIGHSIYVRSDQRGAAIGKALIETLIRRACDIGNHVMVVGIEAGNTISIRLHEKLGFEQVWSTAVTWGSQ